MTTQASSENPMYPTRIPPVPETITDIDQAVTEADILVQLIQAAEYDIAFAREIALHRAVLDGIAGGALNAHTLAQAALTTIDTDYPRNLR